VVTAAAKPVSPSLDGLQRAFPELFGKRLAAAAAAPARPATITLSCDDLPPLRVGRQPKCAELSNEQLLAIAAAGGRAANALRAREVGSVIAHEVNGPDARGHAFAEDLDAAGIPLHRFRAHHALALRLTGLPAVRRAFLDGEIGFAKARALARQQAPWCQQEWLDLARRVDARTLEAHVAAVPRGEAPLPVPQGCTPLRPAHTPLHHRVRWRLDADVAGVWAELRAFLESWGYGDRGAQLAALAGWYLRLRTRASESHHWVVYQRSPETRGARDARTLLAYQLRIRESIADRVAFAFRWIFAVEPDAQRVLAVLDGTTRPAARCLAAERVPAHGRHIPRAVRLATRWRDGEVCLAPGCSRDRVVQHDHFDAVNSGGVAAAAWDRRLCGPCNRARYRGDLDYRSHEDGTTWFFDRHGRPFGSVQIGWSFLPAVYTWALATGAQLVDTNDDLAPLRSALARLSATREADLGRAGPAPPVAA